MNDLLIKMEEYAIDHNVPIINANGKSVLIETVRETRAHKVLEIGTAIGYSTLLIAANSAADVNITTLELEKDRAAVAQNFINASNFAKQITILVGDALETLAPLQDSYDLVFIDAAKGQYINYFNRVLPLLAPNGVIIADNVLFRGLVRSAEKPPRRYKTIVTRLRQYIQLVTTHPEFTTKIHENGDGLAVSYHRGKNIEET